MTSRRRKVHIVTSKLSLQFSLLIETQGLVLIGHLPLDEIYHDELPLVLLLLGLAQVQVLELVLTEQVDDVLIVDLEVADADLGIQFFVEHPAEDLLDAERDESEVVVDSLHGVGLAGAGLSVGEDAG